MPSRRCLSGGEREMESLCFARLCVMPPVMVNDFFFFSS